jgi:hypothetical protein
MDLLVNDSRKMKSFNQRDPKRANVMRCKKSIENGYLNSSIDLADQRVK